MVDSKLFAFATRHATTPGFQPAVMAQLGKGGVPPVASLPVPPLASAETVPVSAPSALAAAVRKRSGSQKRERRHNIGVPANDAEFVAIDERARTAGLSRASFLRACALGTPGPRAKRSPPINAELLAHAVAALNKVGSNVNQIAHALNAAQAVGAGEAVATLAEIRAVLAQIRDAVGRTDRV